MITIAAMITVAIIVAVIWKLILVIKAIHTLIIAVIIPKRKY